MKLIKNNIIPSKGFKAITIYPFIFYRGAYPSPVVIRHEKIHIQQQKELLLIFFYLIYFVEWIFKGYKNISFEKEAYHYENEIKYLDRRIRFAQWKTKK